MAGRIGGSRMVSKLGYAILALLARQPSTGYELSARARRPLGYYWHAQHGQVYPELRRLLAAGLVSFDATPGPGPRDKKVYSPTAAGMAALRDWVVQPPEPRHVRDNLLLKAYATWTVEPADAAALFAGQRADHAERLREYQEQLRNVESRHGGGPPPVGHPEFGNYATLTYGIGFERHRLGWLEWIVAQLQGTSPNPGV
jgi:DNA-binding PadR family transcriptional regulator